MDDSEVPVIIPREINGNFPPSHQYVDDAIGEDEVDSSRVMLPPGLDETDSSAPRTLNHTVGILDQDGNQNGTDDDEGCDDDGYCSQDQMHSYEPMLQNSIPQRNCHTNLNDNISPRPQSTSPRPANSTGKVLNVNMPPNYVVRSNERRTTFRPNYNENTAQDAIESDVGVHVKDISSRQSQLLHRADMIMPESHMAVLRGSDEHQNNLNNRLTSLKHQAGSSSRQQNDDAEHHQPQGFQSQVTRKRKGRDEEENGKSMEPAEPNTKRVRRSDIVPSEYGSAVPATKRQAEVPTNHYDIQGQANWVVQAPQHCTFHIYQPQPNGSGPTKRHPMDWAGLSPHQVTDGGLRAAFEEVSKVIVLATTWKTFARRLPVSRSPALEQELSQLESCGSTTHDKAMAVLLRWWKDECNCCHGDAVKAKLKEGLEDCGLIRIARNLDKIFEKNRGSTQNP